MCVGVCVEEIHPLAFLPVCRQNEGLACLLYFHTPLTVTVHLLIYDTLIPPS